MVYISPILQYQPFVVYFMENSNKVCRAGLIGEEKGLVDKS